MNNILLKVFKHKYYKYSFFCCFFNSYSNDEDLSNNPPVGKLILYQAAKKGLLPNIYYQFKFLFFNDFFIGTTFGIDFLKYKYKNFTIGIFSVRLDLLNALFDIILNLAKSDVTKYKYGLFKDNDFYSSPNAQLNNNYFITLSFIKFLFFKINIGDINCGNIINYFFILFDIFEDKKKLVMKI